MMTAQITKPLNWSLIVPVCNQQVLHSTLLRSPVIDDNCELILKRYHPSAASALNEGMRQAHGEILVLAHQDVYFPEGWTRDLAQAIERLAADDPRWGVLGPVGVTRDGEIQGYIYSTGLGDYVGRPFSGQVETGSLDEMVLVVRRAAGLWLDEALPGFHLYGTDLCLEAERLGLKNYIVPAFCLHNSNGVARLPRAFWDGYLYLRRKWRNRLPIQTCCTRITRSCWPMVRKSARDLLHTTLGNCRVGTRQSDADLFYRKTLALGRE